MSNVSTQRQIRGVRRDVEDLRIHRDAIIEKPKTAGAQVFKKPFDISASGAVLTVTSNLAHTVGVSLRGAQKAPAAGSGFTWNGSTAWTATLAGAKYVYLKFARATAAVSLEMADTPTFANPDDYEYHYLWYVAWATSAIDLDNTIDLRDMIRVEGIA